jgi:hypothetical protein
LLPGKAKRCLGVAQANFERGVDEAQIVSGH